MKKFYTAIFLLLTSSLVSGIIPPKTGVKPPQHVVEFKKMIQTTYQQGYYAEKMTERREIREKVEKGLLPETVLEQDTVFALTLLGQYSNLPSSYSQQAFQNLLFNGPNPTGTVTDYYAQVSYNQMHFTGDAKGWYDVPGTLEQYTGSNSGLGPQGGPKFVLDLITEADETLNFADYIQYYDTQGRPRIGFIAAVHSGADAAAGAFNIWSHRWTFGVITNGQPYTTNDIDPVSGLPVLIDGDYAIQPEIGGSNNFSGPLVTIGVFTHEFGHIFGLPDLYDTDNSSQGLGNWCLMAGGTYGGNGNSSHTPVHMSAWCKKQMGWVTPINITEAHYDLSVSNVEENPLVYRMWKNGSAGPQYFLIENRQKIGFDVNLYEPGFLIYHVDETQNNNTNENRYLVDLEQADGSRHLNNGVNRGDAGDPFPGLRQNTAFDMISNPYSKDYSLQNTYVSVRNIAKDGLLMKADFDIGTKPFLAVINLSVSETVFENGRVEAGESANVNLQIENISPAGSANTMFKFFINETGITINQDEINFSIDGEATELQSITSAFSVSPDFESRMITLHYEIVSEGNSIFDSIEVAIGIPDLLIISKAESNSLADYYRSALLELSNFYEYSYNTVPEFIAERKAIIVFTGKEKSDLFTSAEVDSFTGYVNSGGNIFFTGQNIAEYLETDYPDFLHNFIGISWERNASPFTRYAYGIPGDLFGSQLDTLRFNGTDGANNENSVDIINVNQGFNLSFHYRNDGTDPAGGWIEKSNGGKIVFWGFGFESINNIESSVTRNHVMKSVLTWFDIPTNIIEDEDIVINEYHLFQNYPNPFNPATTIKYYLPENTQVILKVFDVLGREVATLINDKLSAGHHSLNFEAGNLASGIYFYSLQAGSNIFTRKMILLK